MDDTDASPEATALREAEEEIALAPGRVELLGRLPDIVTSSLYRVTPVVGLIDGDAGLRAAPAEVDAIFVLPMAVLRDPKAPARQRHESGDAMHEFWVWPHAEQRIWGATAGILIELAAALAAID